MAASDFEGMWRDLAPVGRSASSGGYFRQPWTSAESELRAWFAEACAARGLTVETDGIGNQVAWWGGSDEPGVLTGSHLDSVLDGGAYDGPLGVASALAAVDLLRDRGFTPSRPLGIGVFVEEEGSRFGRACLGSRLLTGATTWEQARELTDRDGTFLGDAVAAAGLDPSAGLLSTGSVSVPVRGTACRGSFARSSTTYGRATWMPASMPTCRVCAGYADGTSVGVAAGRHPSSGTQVCFGWDSYQTALLAPTRAV